MDQNQSTNPKIVCTNCQAVTTADGKVLWVCENCGTENPVVSEVPAPAVVADVTPIVPEVAPAPAPVAPPVMSAPPVTPSVTPVEPPVFMTMPGQAVPTVADVNAAQAEIDTAAATVTAPIPEVPVVGLGDSASPIMGGSTPPMPPGPVVSR